MTITVTGKRIQWHENPGYPTPGALERVLTLVLQGAGAAALSLGSGFNEAFSTGRSPSTPRW